MKRAIAFAIHIWVGVTFAWASGPPPIVNFSSHDLEAAAGPKDAPKEAAARQPDEVIAQASDRISQRVVNFRYMRAGGVGGAIFRASFVRLSTGKIERDDSFRVWAADAAKNGVMVGAYHLYRPNANVPDQVRYFLKEVKLRCEENPKALRGVPIVLAIDAAPFEGRSDLEILQGIAECAREVRKQTGGASVGFYPESALTKTFANAAASLGADDRRELTSCWLWASRYSSQRPQENDGKFFSLWPKWTLWQYSAGEFWYPGGGLSPKEKNKPNIPWRPREVSPESFARADAEATKGQPASSIGFDRIRYPIGVPGSALPLEGNYLEDTIEVDAAKGSITDGEKIYQRVLAFWKRNGWIALP